MLEIDLVTILNVCHQNGEYLNRGHRLSLPGADHLLTIKPCMTVSFRSMLITCNHKCGARVPFDVVFLTASFTSLSTIGRSLLYGGSMSYLYQRRTADPSYR